MRHLLRRDDPRRRLTLAWAGLRVGLSLAVLTAPGLAAAPWVGRAAAATPAGRVLGRALGGRDLALGVGTLVAAGNGAPLRTWILASGLADAVDAVATAGARSSLPRGGRDLVVAASAGSALLAVALGSDATRRSGVGGRSTTTARG